MNPKDPDTAIEIPSTVEEVDALDKEDVDMLLEIAMILHNSINLDIDSVEDVKEQMQIRDAMKLKFGEAVRHISKLMQDLEDMKRDLNHKKSTMVSDYRRLEDRKFEILIRQKQLRQSPYG